MLGGAVEAAENLEAHQPVGLPHQVALEHTRGLRGGEEANRARQVPADIMGKGMVGQGGIEEGQPLWPERDQSGAGRAPDLAPAEEG